MNKRKKILNLYAGIGGTRKLWGDDHEITAIELNPEIAAIYKDYFPFDKMLIGDAQQFLLQYYKEFDIIFASPPCPTHSEIRKCGVLRGQNKPVYPDMSLYQIIIFLKYYAPLTTKWCVENVKPFYNPLIPYTKKIGRHLFWSNFHIKEFTKKDHRKIEHISVKNDYYGFNLSKYKLQERKDKILRNLVFPDLGKHLLDCALNDVQFENIQQGSLFNINEAS